MTSDLSPTNLDRACWADRAIRTFRQATRCDHEDSLGDLLADLMHWSDGNAVAAKLGGAHGAPPSTTSETSAS
jgi:hypothetical protein